MNARRTRTSICLLNLTQVVPNQQVQRLDKEMALVTLLLFVLLFVIWLTHFDWLDGSTPCFPLCVPVVFQSYLWLVGLRLFLEASHFLWLNLANLLLTCLKFCWRQWAQGFPRSWGSWNLLLLCVRSQLSSLNFVADASVVCMGQCRGAVFVC